MIVDPRPVFHFLEVDDVLLFLGRPRRLRLLELELPVVHDLRDRGSRERRHLDQVEASLLRRGQRFSTSSTPVALRRGRSRGSD